MHRPEADSFRQSICSFHTSKAANPKVFRFSIGKKKSGGEGGGKEEESQPRCSSAPLRISMRPKVSAAFTEELME